MRILLLGLSVALAVLSTQAVEAQQSSSERMEQVAEEMRVLVERTGIADAMEAAVESSAPQLESVLDQISGTLRGLALRMAMDPEVRASALRVTQGMMEVTAMVVAEQGDTLEEALRRAADRISRVPVVVPDRR